MTQFTTLITATELLALQATADMDLVIFDCRAQLDAPNWGAESFERGHIRTAQHLDLDRRLAAAPGSGGRHPLPERTDLASHLRQAGVNRTSQIVVYDDAGGAFAARAWWCVRWLGHEPVAVLDGGLAAYHPVSDRPLSQGPASTRKVGDFQASAPLTRTAAVQQVVAASQAAKTPTALLDARAKARFAGLEEPIDPVAGHIPGAQCHPFTDNLDADGCFRPKAELRGAFAELGAEVICYCGSGVTAAHNVLALVHAGYPEPALYAGSWSHWITDPERAISRSNDRQ